MALTKHDLETIEALIERRLREELGPHPDSPEGRGPARSTVWDALRELAQAQGRTEKRVEELAQAQGRT
ncbi:MAG: hypothetical protein HY720_17705, partial [Planctomycetes bacterium]|nr:hypothetical protein [Planctomycetota bacterium]